MVQVNVGGVPNVAMIFNSGASCNVIDRKLWEELKQNKVKYVSMKSNKKLYPYGSTEPLFWLFCCNSNCTKCYCRSRVYCYRRKRPSITRKRDSYTTECLVPWRGG